MSMSSQFYRDISKVERKIWGIGTRQLKAYAWYLVTAIVLILEIIYLPSWVYFIVCLLTAFLLGTYPTLLLLNQWKRQKRKIELYFIDEEHFFRTNQIRRYEKDEFIPKKEIKETDRI